MILCHLKTTEHIISNDTIEEMMNRLMDRPEYCSDLIDQLLSRSELLDDCETLHSFLVETGRHHEVVYPKIAKDLFAKSVLMALGYTLDDIDVLVRMNCLRRDSSSVHHHYFTKKPNDDAACLDLIRTLTVFMQKSHDCEVSSSAVRNLAVKLLKHEKLLVDKQDEYEFLQSVDEKLETLEEELLKAR